MGHVSAGDPEIFTCTTEYTTASHIRREEIATHFLLCDEHTPRIIFSRK
ncbi:hypothetical protein LSH36_677g00024 [Paralvinella palmiformis]|uniref:Uncharacterized protein n=1 Tax=Paralvinella palmiformis TaxID=53620 RepID=A0AAD9J3M7_9ANNE|nr:hypothetical protein LSH36_677g00024 [Paralvinella palmiformis]